ncbi:Geranylgeranyl diphosphate reductase [Halomicronema hongdechloris C2206]|uniref:Geranylgeranyl diphosphate reductase n=1 Tax=Halomicronema hongdechloris C2206 TaxID=1641165 RepID=A0A1Z3HR95_9CYAN|nr:geranylgeranyl reductase family protein [Halomicronema hongdechloris]ASC72808.1 Geranylgeranyl diphosphate reductase [Halomicronema hongdechloris C2206]
MYDCIIVGAGPAGGTAAYHLAKRGRSVLVLEKATLPRYKPCGGGVSPQVAQWFDFDFTPAISAQVTTVRYTWNLGAPVTSEITTGSPIWMVRRDEFDHFLVQQAVGQGAELRHSTKATGITFAHDSWQVTTAQEPVSGRYLIAADGARGPLAKWLGFTQRQRTSGGRLEIETPRAGAGGPTSPHFEFGLLKNGYVWNFPKADGYSLGSGIFRQGKRASQDLKPALHQICCQFQVDAAQAQPHGHPLNLWNGYQRLHTQQALLAGEAACVVDPFTAEGIRPAIFSGLQAAQAIDAALGGDLQALEAYSQRLNEKWGAQTWPWARRLAQAFYQWPRLGYRVGIQRPSGTEQMVKVLCGERRYADVVHRALRRLSGGVLA